MRFILIALFFSATFGFSQTVTQLHSYGDVDPDLVEQQVRALVPEGPRVSMNRDAGQVIVVAEPGVQDRVAAMLEDLMKPAVGLRFRLRINREVQDIAIEDGVLFSLPLTKKPPSDVVELARRRLGTANGRETVIASGLQIHPIVLREVPPVVRIRVTPVVVFGPFQPYQVVEFGEVTQDLLVTTREFVNLTEKLSSHNFYKRFLRTATEPSAVPKPIGLLLSMDAGPAGPQE